MKKSSHKNLLYPTSYAKINDGTYFVKKLVLSGNQIPADLTELSRSLLVNGRVSDLPFVCPIEDVSVAHGTRNKLLVTLKTKSVSLHRKILPRTTKEIIAFGIEIAEKLYEFEKRGVVYVDLKPENLIFNGTEYIFVDFGSSVLSGMIAKSATLLITSPESLRYEPLDNRHDTYSLSSLMIKELTNVFPNALYGTNKVLVREDKKVYEEICRMMDICTEDNDFRNALKKGISPSLTDRPYPGEFVKMLKRV
jgi:serine/threonine protein kinase